MANMDSFERESCKVVVDGKTYTMTQYKKMMKKKTENNQPKKKAKKKNKEDDFLVEEINKMMHPITILKSMSSYYDHAYRQWGTIANQILNNRYIKPHFIQYRIKVRELDKLINEIKEMKNERAVYQYVEKLMWKVEDIKELTINIINGVNESGFLVVYKTHEAINGKGRRLGLKTLAHKSLKSIGQMEDAIDKLKKIVEEGIDPFEYGNYVSANSRRRLGLT